MQNARCCLHLLVSENMQSCFVAQEHMYVYILMSYQGSRQYRFTKLDWATTDWWSLHCLILVRLCGGSQRGYVMPEKGARTLSMGEMGQFQHGGSEGQDGQCQPPSPPHNAPATLLVSISSLATLYIGYTYSTIHLCQYINTLDWVNTEHQT